MAEVRNYVKTSGKKGTPSLVRVDSKRVRLNWRGSDKALITSQIMLDTEVDDLVALIRPEPEPDPVPVPDPEPTPPANELVEPVLKGTAGDGEIVLSWTIASGDVKRQEIWVNDSWRTELPPSDRSYLVSRLANDQPATVRVVAYDDAGYKNSNTIELTPAGDTPAPTPPSSTAYRFNDLVLDEQFDGTSLDTSRWGVYTSPGNHAAEPGIRAASAVKVENGKLVITATNAPDGQIVTGAIAHHQNYSQGRWETRVRTDVDAMLAMSGVVLLWPEGSMRPGDGEIDFYETTHKVTRKPCYSFVHYAGSQNLQKWFIHKDIDAAEWHTWGCEWAPEYVRIFCDDVLVGETTDKAAIPTWSKGLHICVQFDAFEKLKLPAPLRMEADFVKVYQ